MKNIICFGDSITYGSGAPSEEIRWPTILQRKFDEWQAGVYQVFNKGVNSNTTSLALERIERDVVPLMPGLLLIEFGINDCYHRGDRQTPQVSLAEYKNNLLQIYKTATSLKGTCGFIVNHPLAESGAFPQGNGKSFNANLNPYNKVIVELAASKLGSLLINIPKELKERGIELSDFLGKDGVHLQDNGNRNYANIVFEQLRKYFDEKKND